MKGGHKPIRIMDFRGTYRGGGGPDKTILLSASLHDRERVDVLVVYLRDPKDREFQISEKAKKLQIAYVEVEDCCLVDPICLLKLHAIIKDRKIQLLHAHDEKTLLYGWLLKLFNPKLRIICTCHLFLNYLRNDFPSASAYWNSVIRNRVSLFLMKRFRKPVMAVSAGTKKQLVEKGINEKDVTVLYNGIDIASWRREKGQPLLRKELNLKDDELLVGTVARIDYQKDFPTFFKVVEGVKKKIPNTKFVIIGEGKGNELSELKKSVKQRGLHDDVFFTGHRNDLLNVYPSLDLFLMTSIMEGLPNTVLEAMAMKVPVVSTAVAGVPELVLDGETGFLSKIGDVEGLVDSTVELLSSSELPKQFGEAGRKRVVDYFNFEKRVRLLEDLYEQYVNP